MLYNIKELRNYIMILQNITIILFQTKVNIKQIQAISFKLQNKVILPITNTHLIYEKMKIEKMKQ